MGSGERPEAVVEIDLTFARGLYTVCGIGERESQPAVRAGSIRRPAGERGAGSPRSIAG